MEFYPKTGCEQLKNNTMPQTEYEYNLVQLKTLIDAYTIADLKSMIYGIPVSPSGACCYPAIQTLVSLMELLGKICTNEQGKDAFKNIIFRLGERYQKEELVNDLYEHFRHGIAHSSLAKGKVLIKKDGDTNYHLCNNVIDVKIIFEDFLPIYESLFSQYLLDSKKGSFYEENLRTIFRGLNYPWITDFRTTLIEEKKRRAWNNTK